MEKLKLKQKRIIRFSFLIIYGLAFVSFGILIPGKWLIKDKGKIHDEIDLTNFQGEIYPTKYLRINPQVIVERPSEGFNIFLKNPKSILVYDDGVSEGSYENIKIYLQDSENCGKFYFVEKNYKKEVGIITLDYENGKIIVRKYPPYGSYFIVFVIFVFCVWYGVVKIINNINNLRGKGVY